MSYFDFLNKIKTNRNEVNVIFELGSRDLKDAIKLLQHFDNSKIYSFECNYDCLIECNKTLSNTNEEIRNRINLIDKAVALLDGQVVFYSFDIEKYNNMGASSMLKIDFSKRDISDPDYNLPNPQKETIVNGTRLDTFMKEKCIENIDLLCIDLQGYELNALKSLGDYLHNVKYIITECSIASTYTNGATFAELNAYLTSYNFKYVSSNKFYDNFPDLTLTGFSEFDALYVRN